MQFRIDLDLYEILVELAHPQTPSGYVADIIIGRLAAISAQRESEPTR